MNVVRSGEVVELSVVAKLREWGVDVNRSYHDRSLCKQIE